MWLKEQMRVEALNGGERAISEKRTHRLQKKWQDAQQKTHEM
jgi:hypothetical protein